METKYAVITAAALLSFSLIGAVALHGVLNKYELTAASENGVHAVYRLDKRSGEVMQVRADQMRPVTLTPPE
jgi:hypothetical protein